MQPHDGMVAPGEPDRAARRAWVRWGSRVFGLLLLVAAVLTISRNRLGLAQAWDAMRTAPLWLIASLVLAPLVNILVVAMSFWLLTDAEGRVGRREMIALITSAWLLNQLLPLSPGLFGRVAYHKAVNGIPVRRTLAATLQVIACSFVAIAVLMATVLAAAPFCRSQGSLAACSFAPLVVFGVAALALTAFGPARLWGFTGVPVWRYPACVGLRYIDLLVWVARYALVFAAIGQAVSWDRATIVGAASEVAMLLPVQYGPRQWVVALVNARLQGQPGLSVADLTPGLLADVLTAAVEAAVSVPLGIAATLWLRRRLANRPKPKPRALPGV